MIIIGFSIMLQPIRAFQKQLGCKLLVRSTRGVQLTQEGRKLYQHVSVAYQHLHMAEVELMNEQRMDQGYITISASEIALHLLLLPVLEKFHKNGVSGDPCRKSGNGAEHEDKKTGRYQE